MSTQPIASMMDVKQLLYLHLMADDTVTALVEDRIYTEHNFDPSSFPLEYPCIVIESLYGDSSYEGSLQDLSFDIYTCSDQNMGKAGIVYNAVFLSLQAERLVDLSGVIGAAGYARELDRPIDGYNERAKAWIMRGRWSTMTAG